MYVISTVYVPSTHFYPKMLGVFFGNQSLKCLQRTLKRFWTWNPVPMTGIFSHYSRCCGKQVTFFVRSTRDSVTFLGQHVFRGSRTVETTKHLAVLTNLQNIEKISHFHTNLPPYTPNIHHNKKRWNMVSHHHQFSNLQELPRRLFRPKNESPQRLYSTRTKSNLVRVVKSKSPVSHTDFVHCNRRIPLVSKEFSTMLKFLSWVELIVFDQRREKDHGRLYWYWIICRLQQCVPDTIWSKTF